MEAGKTVYEGKVVPRGYRSPRDFRVVLVAGNSWHVYYRIDSEMRPRGDAWSPFPPWDADVVGALAGKLNALVALLRKTKSRSGS